MKQSLEKVLLDQKKVAQYHQNLLKKKSDLETKKVWLKMCLEEVNTKLENIELTLKENRCVGNVGVNLELQAEKQRNILQTEESIKQLQSDKWQLELEIYR